MCASVRSLPAISAELWRHVLHVCLLLVQRRSRISPATSIVLVKLIISIAMTGLALILTIIDLVCLYQVQMRLTMCVGSSWLTWCYSTWRWRCQNSCITSITASRPGSQNSGKLYSWARYMLVGWVRECSTLGHLYWTWRSKFVLQLHSIGSSKWKRILLKVLNKYSKL